MDQEVAVPFARRRRSNQKPTSKLTPGSANGSKRQWAQTSTEEYVRKELAEEQRSAGVAAGKTHGDSHGPGGRCPIRLPPPLQPEPTSKPKTGSTNGSKRKWVQTSTEEYVRSELAEEQRSAEIAAGQSHRDSYGPEVLDLGPEEEEQACWSPENFPLPTAFEVTHEVVETLEAELEDDASFFSACSAETQLLFWPASQVATLFGEDLNRSFADAAESVQLVFAGIVARPPYTCTELLRAGRFEHKCTDCMAKAQGAQVVPGSANAALRCLSAYPTVQGVDGKPTPLRVGAVARLLVHAPPDSWGVEYFAPSTRAHPHTSRLASRAPPRQGLVQVQVHHRGE